MTYLQPHRRPYQRFARITAGVTGAIIIAVVVILIVAPHIFAAFFTSIARPFWRLEFSIGSGSLASPEQLLAENERLKIQLDEIRVASEVTLYTLAENTELKALLGREVTSVSTSSEITRPLSSSSGTLAAVLKRPPLSPYDEIIIDIGREHRVSTSSQVYAVGDILIGRVIDVLGDTSRVKLFSSPGERYDVLIGSSHTPATAVGRGGGQYEAQVSREAQIKEGDFVSDSAMSDSPFARVVSVLSDPTQPFEIVIFAPLVNIYELRWVIVR